jgi:hypothetical protein
MIKNYYTMDNVGSSKYSISDHDGVSTHKDGSPFYGMHLFKNKRKHNAKLKELKKAGYIERNLIPQTS